MSLTLPITFASGGAKLDRATHLRDGTKRLLRDPNAQLLPLCEGRVLISQGDGWRRLGWIPPLPETLKLLKEEPVFLGIFEEQPIFAGDFSHIPRERLEKRFISGAQFFDLRNVAGEIGAGEATVAATAKGVVDWHRTHPFCARCGGPTAIEDGGWRRKCQDCGAQHFPRIDPVVIMLITHGERVLLGRQDGWPDRVYSLIAGFMEPGESLEDAVRRETMEETGIQIGRVRYLACQPWPFPASLMLACAGEALSTEIAIDQQELEDAMWVSRTDMPDILAGKHQQFAAPRISAIARVVLSAWASGEIEEFP
ncbi:MAG: NAD(+) diphosphatase [Pseudomonadota bacterium]